MPNTTFHCPKCGSRVLFDDIAPTECYCGAKFSQSSKKYAEGVQRSERRLDRLVLYGMLVFLAAWGLAALYRNALHIPPPYTGILVIATLASPVVFVFIRRIIRSRHHSSRRRDWYW